MNEMQACLEMVQKTFLNIECSTLEMAINHIKEKQSQLRVVAREAIKERVPHINSNLELLETLIYDLNNILDMKIKYRDQGLYKSDS